GTSRTTVRSSTRTICWMTGTRITSPRPFTFQNRPSWKTTPRWYSRSTRSDEAAMNSSSRIRTNGPNSVMDTPWRPLPGRLQVAGRRHARHHAVDADDADSLAARKARRCLHLPRLAANIGPAGLAGIIEHFHVGANQRDEPADDR